MYKKLTWILAVILFILVLDRVYFTSSDIRFILTPEFLNARANSELKINIFRVNILGLKVPFSKIDARFSIEEGANLIEITDDDNSHGEIKVRSKGIEGEAVIGVYSLRSGLLIKKLLIKILPRDYTQNNFRK